MTTADQAAASPTSIELAGKTWIMSPFRAKDSADLVRFCRTAYVTHWRTSLEGMSQDLIDRKVCEAVETSSHFTSTSSEVLEVMGDFAGLGFLLYLLLRQHHPDITISEAQELLCHPESLVPDPALMHYVQDHIVLLKHLDTPQEKEKKRSPSKEGLSRKGRRKLFGNLPLLCGEVPVGAGRS